MNSIVNILHMVTLTMVLWLCTACSSTPHDELESKALPDIYPDYIGVTIPAATAPLNFGVRGHNDGIYVVARGSKEGEITVSGDYADFDISQWHALTRKNKGDSIIITVSVNEEGQWTRYRPFAIHVSTDSIGEWGLTYRLIPPGYETYGDMGLYQRDLSSFEQTPIIENADIEMGCVNCHTTNRTHPQQFTFHVRGDLGATIVYHDGKAETLEPRNEQLGGGMVYPFWHPGGRYVAYATNQTHQLFHQRSGQRVEVFDNSSDIVMLDTRDYSLLKDDRVAQDDQLENFPAFSPDGRWLYFCKSHRIDSIWKNYEQIKYDICRIAFDPEEKAFTGEVETIIKATEMGKSANQPRLSYDGKYLLYTISDYGCFPIWHREADLWMMNLGSGVSVPLTAANSDDAESFHNWSLNSRWIVFTSRRDNGLYTQLYLAHVNTDGTVAKAFMLPQKDPIVYEQETIYSFNTPDFASQPVKTSELNLPGKISDKRRTPTTLISRP